jgi:hypothetical protein
MPTPHAQPVAPAQIYTVGPRESNGIGIAGFIFALLGIVTIGLLSPIAVVLSLIGLGRAPRGWAAFGLILGLLGCLVWVVGGIALVIAAVATAGFVGAGSVAMLAMFEPEQVEITGDMARTAIALRLHVEQHEALPDTLDDLGLRPATRIDPWGTPYRYTVEVDGDPGFDLVSFGPDATPDTDDDIHLTRLDRAWEHAMDDFGAQMQSLENNPALREMFEGRRNHTDWFDDRAWRPVRGERAVIVESADQRKVLLEDEITRLQQMINELERSIADDLAARDEPKGARD